MLLFADAPELPMSIRLPLSIVNFLEYAIWGAWFVVLGNYLDSLGFSRKDIGRIYATMALGTIISPIFIGTIADRYFSSQLLFGILHLVGAVLLYWMAHIRTAGLFYWVALLYAICYGPTTALANSIIFANILDPTRDFPTIRVLGTIGWIVAGMSLALLIKAGEPVNNRPLLLASFLSVVLGVYSFTLPDTPPGAAGEGAVAEAVVKDGKLVEAKIVNAGSGYRKAPGIAVVGGGGEGAAVEAKLSDTGTIGAINVTKAGSGFTSAPTLEFPKPGIPFVKAFSLLQDRSFAVFFGVSFAITIALAFYYSFTALYLENALHVRPERIGPLMTIGQWMEIIFLLALPFVLKSPKNPDQGFLDMKAVLMLGMAAWGIRYAIFASLPPLSIALIGVALHGICFDFFFAAAFIHVENTAPKDIQASGQALFVLLTYGIGMFLGTEASGRLNQLLTQETTDPQTGQTKRVTNWKTFWLIPCIAVFICLGVFVAFF